jgi:hypothetical protein
MNETVTLKEYFLKLIAWLKTYVDRRFSDQDKAVQAALASQEKAVIKAENAAEERFKLLNELRQGVATKEQLEALEKLIATLAERVTRIEAIKQGSTEMRVLIFAVIGLGIAIMGFIGFKG